MESGIGGLGHWRLYRTVGIISMRTVELLSRMATVGNGLVSYIYPQIMVARRRHVFDNWVFAARLSDNARSPRAFESVELAVRSLGINVAVFVVSTRKDIASRLCG